MMNPHGRTREIITDLSTAELLVGGGLNYRAAGQILLKSLKEVDKEVTRLKETNAELVEILEETLNWAEYETEYDGCVYVICQSCDGQNYKHNDGCEIDRLRALITKAKQGGA